MHITKEQKAKFRNKYALWVYGECSCPIDEIEYLFDNIPEDHQKQIIEDIKEREK
jgi:hypothetical protein